MLPPGATVPAIRLGLADSRLFGAQGSWEGPLRCSVVDLDMSRVHDPQVIAKFRADQARVKDLPGGSALHQAHVALAMWFLQSSDLAAKSKRDLDEILSTLDRMNSPLAEALRKRLAAK